MRLIHANPLCRDIAIWYDEFLVPGEGFNQAIMDALEKSSAFALVVTPNLLENPNYVMTTEWPAAHDAGKPAIPIEALPTDPAKLAALYAGLGDSVSAEDRAAVASRLVGALRETALEAHAGDPAHDYLIGLAYLSGIDVEVDRDRAIGLITAAANGGLPEACERLVAMYRTGEGVTRDYRTAIDWQERLIKILKWVAEDDPTEENRAKLCDAYAALGDDCLKAAWLGKAQKAYNSMLDCAIALDQMEGVDARSKVSDACTKLGELYAADGAISHAEDFFKYALDFDMALVEEAESSDQTVACWRRLVRSCGNMGELKAEKGDFGWARKCYEDSLRFSRKLVEWTGSVTDRRGLAQSCARLGRFHKEHRGFPLDKAPYEPLFQEAARISEELEAETGSAWSKRDLAEAYLTLGDLSSGKGGAAATMEWYSKALSIIENLSEQTDSIEDRRLLARAARSYSASARKADDFGIANPWSRRAYDESSRLCLEAGSRAAYLEFAQSCRELARVYAARGIRGRARDAYKEAIDADQHAQFLVPASMEKTFLEPLNGMVESCMGLSYQYMLDKMYVWARAIDGVGAAIADEIAEKTEDTVKAAEMRSIANALRQQCDEAKKAQYKADPCSIIDEIERAGLPWSELNKLKEKTGEQKEEPAPMVSEPKPEPTQTSKPKPSPQNMFAPKRPRFAIVFYSLEGNTRLAATELAKRIDADLFEIRTVKPYPAKGPLKILVGGKDATFDRRPEIERIDADFDVYDLIVIGTPVWADKVSAPINSLLENRSLHGFGIALLVTSASGETDKCADDLAKKAGLRVKPRTLSLKNPLKMDADELAAQIDAFAAELKRMKNSDFFF